MRIKPQKQLFRHDPDNGVYGDCHRTCYAIILNKNADQVPHFCNGEGNWIDKVNKYNKEEGIQTITIVFSEYTEITAILISLEYMNPEIPYILSGTSKNNTNHSVVGGLGEILCDPSLDDSGIVGPCDDGFYWVQYITRPAS